MLKPSPAIVLVHGAWADGSSWNRVIRLLLASNFAVIAVQLPLTSAEDDLAATKQVVADVEGPTVRVGHSWGGMATTQAALIRRFRRWSMSRRSPRMWGRPAAV